jgi:RimJ/RimL family protein N-acetyltransferase
VTDPVRFRPATLADVELLMAWRATAETDDPYDFFGHRPSDLRRLFEEHGLLSPDDGLLVVELADGTVAGEVGWHGVHYGPPPDSRATNIGIGLAPAHRGQGYGSAAQRLLAEYLFAHTTVHRVEASTDVANVAEQRALEKAGFTREGVLRGAQWRSGAWHDLVSYARLRGDA